MEACRMIVPTYQEGPIVDKDGRPLEGFAIFLQNLIQNMTLSVSDEGYLIPNVNNSQQGVIQASFQTNVVNPESQTISVGVQIGTMVFNTQTVNGGSSGNPLGQLYVLLNDGTFHPVTNT
jgi:hypothetical protein